MEKGLAGGGDESQAIVQNVLNITLILLSTTTQDRLGR